MNENNFPSCGSDYFNGPPTPIIDHHGFIVGQTISAQYKDADAPVIWFRPLHAGEWGNWREIDTPATNVAPQTDEPLPVRYYKDGGITHAVYESSSITYVEKLRQALERIADPRNTHFAGDAQVVARAALASAPVAGEADEKCEHDWVDGQNKYVSGDVHVCTRCLEVRLGKLGAAPQASEAGK